MNSNNDTNYLGDLCLPTSKERPLCHSASHFYQQEIGLSTPLPTLDNVFKVIGMIDNNAANEMCGRCLGRDLRSASILTL